MIDFTELNSIARRATEGEFMVFISIHRSSGGHEAVRITLEKGSTYGKFHMKVDGIGATPSEAFEAALRNFPPNPLDGASKWDTSRISGPIEDGEFDEVPSDV